jgi:hypothetical protein
LSSLQELHFLSLTDCRALLEAIATGLVSGGEAIKDYVRCTLLYRTLDKKLVYSIMNSALQELINEALIVFKEDESYEATLLGQAVVASAFSPEDGLFVHEELKRALQAFVMDGDMHIFYMFTPFQVAMNTPIDWPIFREQLDRLDESGLRALQFVGVQPGFVNTMSVSMFPPFSKLNKENLIEYLGSNRGRLSKKIHQPNRNKPVYIGAPTQPFNFVT